MQIVAPNLGTLIGDTVAARLISHAGTYYKYIILYISLCIIIRKYKYFCKVQPRAEALFQTFRQLYIKIGEKVRKLSGSMANI